MDLLDFLKTYWLVFAGVVAIIVWQVRHEGRTNGNEKRIDALEKRLEHTEQQVNTMESALVKELSEVKQSLARIEGYLQGKKEAET